MRKLFLLAFASLAFAGCGLTSTVSKKPIETKDSVSDRQKETVAVHSVDVAKFNEGIVAAEKALKASSSDTAKKAALAEVYFKRGFALTEARQYASAIGDFRRALKQVPDHADSKKWIATIANIYKSMNREIPKEGEEPKPLEFKKEKSST